MPKLPLRATGTLLWKRRVANSGCPPLDVVWHFTQGLSYIAMGICFPGNSHTSRELARDRGSAASLATLHWDEGTWGSELLLPLLASLPHLPASPLGDSSSKHIVAVGVVATSLINR